MTRKRGRRLLKKFRVHATEVRVYVTPRPCPDDVNTIGLQVGGSIFLSESLEETWESTYGHESAHLLDELCGLSQMWGWTTEQVEAFANLMGPALIDWLKAHGGHVPRKPKKR